MRKRVLKKIDSRSAFRSVAQSAFEYDMSRYIVSFNIIHIIHKSDGNLVLNFATNPPKAPAVRSLGPTLLGPELSSAFVLFLIRVKITNP